MGIREATNGYLTIRMEDAQDRIGLFTVKTGQNHPSPDKNVFFPTVGTSYITVRADDGNSKVMWVNTHLPISETGLPGYTVQRMNPHADPATIQNLGTGFRVRYELPNFYVIQEVKVIGSVIEKTAVQHTVVVENKPASPPLDFGLRYLWDWTVDTIDNVFFRTRAPDGNFTQDFTDFPDPAFLRYQAADSDLSPSFEVFGTVTRGTLCLSLTSPTAPDELRFAAWSEAKNTAWSFSNTGGVDDSAIVYFWGFSSTLQLQSGESQTFTQYVTTHETALKCAVPVLKKDVSTMADVCGGDDLTYTVSWSNVGDDTSYDLTITDTMPGVLVYRSPLLEFFAQPDAAGTPMLKSRSWATT